MITKQPKYRVVYGFRPDDHIIVDRDELEKLQYAQIKGAFFVGKYGQVETDKIIAVRPDYKETYRAMPEYTLVGEDFDEIQKEHGNIASYIGEAEVKVKYLIQTKQEHLIGKNVELPQLENKGRQIDTKSLADKKKTT